MAKVYIALGANLGDPVQTLKDALLELASGPALQQLRASSLYRSKPMGPADQPDYVNAVVTATTELEPLALLDYLQAIEQQFGRQRLRHWGPRTLDLDILLVDDLVSTSERLTLPHPGLTERDFVVVPLAELAPTLVLPNGQTLQQLKQSMQHHDLVKIS